MRIVRTVAGLGFLLLLGLILTTAASAQESKDESLVEAADAQSKIGISGLADDPPAGKKILYMFTGVHHRNASPEVVTTVHCTNYGAAVDFRVEIFDHDVSNNYIPLFTTIPSNHTVTISTADFFPTEDIEYGSGRILTDDGPETKVICTVQVTALNSSDEPNAMTKLHLFDSEGNLIGPNPGPGPGPSPSSGGIFMPIIFKNS
jgi:hypothetical protein